jgi:hypothetical protein
VTRLAGFDAGGGVAVASRFMAASKLNPGTRRSMAFGIIVFPLLAGNLPLFYWHQKQKVKEQTTAAKTACAGLAIPQVADRV